MQYLTVRNVLLAGTAFVLAVVATLFAMRESMDPLTRDGLAAARSLWADQGIDSYKISYTMHGSQYDVAVPENGQIAVLVNGQPPHGSNNTPFLVEGLFDTLEMELDNLESPSGPFAGRQQSVLMRVRFHPELGYVERYLRSSGGYGKGVSIELIEFAIDAGRD